MNDLSETFKQKLFIKTVVTTPTYEQTLTPLVEFLTKDDGAFAKQALGFKQ